MARKLKTYSPIDGSLYVQRELVGEEQMLEAVLLADKAQDDWALVPLEKKKHICSLAVECFEEKKELIAEELCWQMGRPIRYAEGEVSSFAARARHMISISDQCLASSAVDDKPGFKRFIKKCPVGTVAVLAPWNYPLHTPINAIIPALLAGNSVILKHSAQTPLCGERIVEAFADAGLPQGVLQCLHMSHDTAKTMLEQPSIKAVTFTGSVEAGKDIEKACAGRFINLTLELGGKDPAYIRSDADLEYAVESTVDGAFFNSGQSCCGLERIYVHQSIYSAYVERFVELTREYVLGCSNDQATTLGPVVNASAAARIRKQIQGAIDSGAKANIDVTDFPLDQNGTAYLAPQVLTNVDHSMSVMRDETFGPVVGIMAVSSDEEAIKLMNDSDLGLSAAIYSNDLEAATALGEKIETGTFFVNRCDFLDPELVWTGVKNTGRGYSLSVHGFDNYIQLKSYHIKSI